MIETLGQLVSIRSVSRQEHAAADFVATVLRQAGLEVQRAGNNVWCEVGDAPRPRLLLNSHLDTVPPGNGWSADPWTPRREDGRVIGLGANDAKGCVTAMIAAATRIGAAIQRGTRFGGTLVLALTAEEEISGQGLATILGHLRPLDAALVGEPTGLTPMIAQRGLLVLRGIARGHTRHPANTPLETADNAIQNAADDLRRLRDFDWGGAHPLLGRCHGHVTRIGGGVANNVIPDACEFTLDIRTVPTETHAALFDRLRAALASELVIHSERLEPIETSPDTPIVQAVLRALPGSKPAGSPAMSDMVFLRGVPAVKFGPGQSVRSHTPDEYLTDVELQAGADAYERVALEYMRSVSREGRT